MAVACTSVRGITRSPEGSRDSARGLKFTKIKTNMVARGLLRKTLFPPGLVSCLHYQLFLTSKKIHPAGNFKGKLPFRSLCWNVNENCDVDVAIDRAGYQFKKRPEKYYSSGILRSLYLASLNSGYLWYSSFTAYAANDNSEKENAIRGLFAFIRLELRA